MSALPTLASPQAVQAALAAPGLLLVDVYTPSCIICKRIEPMVAAAVQSYGVAVRGRKLDAEAQLEFAERYDIRGVPTVLLFRDGELLGRKSGFVTAGALRDWIAEHHNPSPKEG